MLSRREEPGSGVHSNRNFGTMDIDWWAGEVRLALRDGAGTPVRTHVVRFDELRPYASTGARGLIGVDSDFRTSVAHIYAAGDVIGAPALAATGMEQARAAISRALGSDLKKHLATLLPMGVYTIPEIGAVGETEQSLQAAGIDYVAGRWRMADTPRGCILGDEHGMMKLLFRKSDMRLLGVHVIGEQATETVHVGMVAMLSNADAHLFNQACFNYPTLGDLYKYATYDAFLKCRAKISPRH